MKYRLDFERMDFFRLNNRGDWNIGITFYVIEADNPAKARAVGESMIGREVIAIDSRQYLTSLASVRLASEEEVYRLEFLDGLKQFTENYLRVFGFESRLVEFCYDAVHRRQVGLRV